MDDLISQVHHGGGDNVAGDKITIVVQEKAAISGSEENLIETIAEEHSYLPMMGISQPLDIEKIFVTLTISPETISGEKVSFDTRGLQVDTTIQELNTDRDIGSPYRVSTYDAIPLHRILSYNKTIILGNPGSGKTTLLKHLLMDICKKRYCVGYIPLFIKLANISSFGAGCIMEYLKGKYESYYELLKTAELNGNLFFFLDGFDEIATNEQTIIASEAATLSAKNRVCISSRTAVFPRNMLPSDFRIFECVGFSTAQRKKYIKNWFPMQQALADRVYNQIINNIHAAGLSKNPLLLSLMVFQFSKNPAFDLPRKRIEIYLGAIRVLIDKPENQRAKTILPELKYDLLEHIAYDMSENGTEVISSTKLSQIIGSWKAEKERCAECIQESTTEIIEWIRRSGILYSTQLTAVGDRQYRFMHLTFLESLTASYVKRKLEPLGYARQYFGTPRKEETVRLLLSLLNQDQAFEFVEYLDQISGSLAEEERFFIIAGRYISDLQYQNHPFFQAVFSHLIGCVFTGTSRVSRQELVISLACLCSANQSNLMHFISSVRDRLTYVSSLGIYVDVLKLSPSMASGFELRRLLNEFEQFPKTDLMIEIIGMLIDAMKFIYDDSFWMELYKRYVDGDGAQLHTHLSAITTGSLEHICSLTIKELLTKKLAEGNLGLLDMAILYKYEDIPLNQELFKQAFAPGADHLQSCYMALASNIEIELSEADIRKLLEHLPGSPDKMAYFLCSAGLFSGKSAINSVEGLSADSSTPMVLRCAALYHELRAIRNDPDKLREMAKRLCQLNIPDLYAVAISLIPEMTSSQFANNLLQEMALIQLPEQTLSGMIHFLSANTVEGEMPLYWLHQQQDRLRVGSGLHLLCLIAMARHNDCYLQKTIHLHYSDVKSPEQVFAVCKALSYLNTEDAAKEILVLLEQQEDIGVISAIIRLLANLSQPVVYQRLLQYLDTSNWPTIWPKPLPALQRGEQRPTDNRKLNIIMALNYKCRTEQLSALRAIANDELESYEVRRAAEIVINNLCWTQKPF